MKAESKTKVTLRLDKTLWKAVQHRALEQDTTAESIVTAALVDHLGIKLGDFDIVVTYDRPKKGRKGGKP
jgi:hypothetical protein